MIFFIEYPSIAGHTVQNAQQVSTLDIPPILSAQAQDGILLNMKLVGIEGIDPNQQIPISSFQWHIGSLPESVKSSSTGSNSVRVKFCWDIQGNPDSQSSCWMRVSQSWAGKSWGDINIPRIGQEVIVNFLEGDPDRPIIIGSVFASDVKITSSTVELNQSPPQRELFMIPGKIQWEFKDFQTGETFCGGLDVKSNQILDCQHIL